MDKIDALNHILMDLNGESEEKHGALATEPEQLVEVVEDSTFSYDGFQVVRAEFFAHIYEPSITFNRNKVYVNTICLRKMPDTEYVQILVNPDEKKLLIRPCLESDKDSIRWRTTTSQKHRPKQVTCRLFFAKVVHLMGWNQNYRYKLLGKQIKNDDEFLFVFDLTASEVYQRVIKEGERETTSRTPLFPNEWRDSFGLPFEEHKKQLQINIFDGYAVFSMQNSDMETRTRIQVTDKSNEESLT